MKANTSLAKRKGGQFSYTAAIGLFINIINFILIMTVNRISKKTTEVGLF